MSLTSMIGSCRLLCYMTLVESRVIACNSREIENILLYYYHLEKYKWWKEKMVTGQGYGLGIGGYKRLCPAANGAWLGYTVFPVRVD